MFGLLEQLKRLQAPIRIGIAGIGSIGSGMLRQASITPGIQCVAIADIELDRALTWATQFKINHRVVHTLNEMHDVIRQGRLAVCADGELAARCEMMDVFVEATNSVAAGGHHGTRALECGKHLVMMNYEAGLMFGGWLMRLAEENGLVYSACDGDQPTALRRVIAELEFMSLKLVMAGNIKGFLDRYADPTSIVPEADKRNLDHRMCTSYTDGTKLCVEMAVLANALGLHATQPGMIGPRMSEVHDVFDHFDFNALWDGKQGVVDFILGANPKGGVFAVGYTDDAFQQETLRWYPPDMGPGPFYLFYRPYHLGPLEAMATVAEAALNKRSVLKPTFDLQTNVYAYAKHPLRAGESLDGIGGYTCYGMIENCRDNALKPGLPICLADNVRLTRDIPRDQKILLDDVLYDPQDYAFDLHRRAVEAAQKNIQVE